MKCFNHPVVDAVALCKSCGRALCPNCVVEVGLGCSCRDRCEADVATLNELVTRARASHQVAGSTYARSGLFFLVLSLPMLGFGALAISDHTAIGSVALLFGLSFASLGISYLASARKLR